MKFKFYLKTIGFSLFAFVLNASGQNLTVNETVNYINKRLSENPYMPNGGNLEITNQIEITNDNKFILYEYQKAVFAIPDRCIVYINEMKLTDFKNIEEKLMFDFYYSKINISGIICCYYSDCASARTLSQRNLVFSSRNSTIGIGFRSSGEDLRLSLQNAIKYLFNKLIEEGRIQKPSEDPFLPRK